jgi:hypothetical protein
MLVSFRFSSPLPFPEGPRGCHAVLALAGEIGVTGVAVGELPWVAATVTGSIALHAFGIRLGADQAAAAVPDIPVQPVGVLVHATLGAYPADRHIFISRYQIT